MDCTEDGHAFLDKREDLRISNGHNVMWRIEVCSLGEDLTHVIFGLFLVEVHAVDAVQDGNNSRHRLEHPEVDCTEDGHAFLDKR